MQTLINLPGKDLVLETIHDGFCTDTIDNPNPGFYIMEIWKDIENYKGRYKISNFGRIKSLRRNRNRTVVYTELILKPVIRNKKTSGIYFIVGLHNGGFQKTFSVHRLVAKAFIPNPQNKPHINHKDGDKHNNHVDNLEWCTCSENLKHSYSIGLISRKGEKHHFAKLNEFQVRVIRKCPDLMQKELAEIFGVGKVNISVIKSRKTWNHI